jgi:hypothetical protein
MGALSFHEFPLTVKKSIIISNYTKELVTCIGSTGNYLICEAEISEGLQPKYQWFKDDIEIPNETKPILNFQIFNYKNSGNYKCKVYADGFNEQVWTGIIPVYAVKGTDITEQPADFVQTLGNDATFKFDAHVNGKNLIDAIANEEVKIQWYKFESETKSIAIDDNMLRISGSQSNYLTIRNLKKEDFGKYWAEISGLCGTDKTEIIELIEGVDEITIESQSMSQIECENEKAELEINASTSSSKNIKYQWFKGNTQLNDISGIIEGTRSKNLVIYNLKISDSGDYFVKLNLDGTTVEKLSQNIKLSVLSKPVIINQSKSVNIKAGDKLLLELTIANADDTTMKFQWFHNGNLIAGANESILQKSVSTIDDDGEYWCDIENYCGLTLSDKINVAITTTTTDITELKSGEYLLSSPLPSPVKSVSNIKYYIPEMNNIKITISNLDNSFETILLNQLQNSGEYSIDIDIEKLNLSSGIYFLKMDADGVVIIRKFIVLK